MEKNFSSNGTDVGTGSGGQKIADRARRYTEQGREQVNRAARNFTLYAREHTGVVTLSALAFGILVGRLLIPARD